MRPSVTKTVSVPALGSRTAQPGLLVQAPPTTPMRVLVRNVGGVQLYIAHEGDALNNVSSNGATYQLPPGASDVFIVAESQSLFAASLGSGGLISIAVSEAIPLAKAWMES